MKINQILLSLVAISSLSICIPTFANQGHGNGPGNNSQGPINEAQLQNSCILEPDSSNEISQTAQEQLQFMREEEKMARDVYVYLYDLWSNKVFLNISKAEQMHMDSVNKFLQAYGITDPALANYGQFTNQTLQALYDSLIEMGSASLTDALMAGALIEEVDIKDLLTILEQIDDPAIKQMYTSLLYGSYNHLRAFVNQLKSLGVTYASQGYLTQQQVDEIISGTVSQEVMSTAKAMDSSGSLTSSDSCFINMVFSNSQQVTNNYIFNSEDNAQLSSTIRINTQNLGQNAKLVAVAGYTSDTGETSSFMRNNASWITWDGNIHSLSFAEQITLAAEQKFEVFIGQLGEQTGEYIVSVGYVLEDGSIIYNAEPMRFRVQQ
jgi:hypothetical protein